ncbi:MAG: DUF4291 domain-containing protein [Pseudomonadota bacterium]|nr:DUF4291 domain-containing protein [Pseudomonadota bacterium]
MLQLEPYTHALSHWPPTGQHILAQFDADTIVVYQAYNPAIAEAAVADQRFGGGGFSLGRMSWIKPNFLWMMYRCGWATKPNQERVLAIRLRRTTFDALLRQTVASSFSASGLPDEGAWRDAVAASDVRLQWDPDHAPGGRAEARRAIQLGVRKDMLRQFAYEWPVRIEDITPFVLEQGARVGSAELMVPVERVLPLAPDIAAHIQAAQIGAAPQQLERRDA